MSLSSLVPPGVQLTEEQESHIHDLQDEIDEIWSRRGSYKIDDKAWESMPLFMENITDEDLQRNADCAALASIAYDEMLPEDIAENRKQHGNKALQLALTPEQVNKENLARAAIHCYTEALNAKCKNPILNSQLYANRSLAQYVIQNFGHGLEDAQRSIILNSDYTKAYYRAARCAERLGKFDLALDLLSKGRSTNLQLKGPDLEAFADLERLCREGSELTKHKQKKCDIRSRAHKAEQSALMRALKSSGIRLSNVPEVSSEQMGIYGGYQPYFDTDGLLHVPILFMYDEYQQTDFMQDIACDVCVAELVNELMPFPWDDRGRYKTLDDIVVFFKIDDGIKMAEYYEIDMSWPLIKIFCSETYRMPMLLPVLHVVCRNSELLQQLDISKLN